MDPYLSLWGTMELVVEVLVPAMLSALWTCHDWRQRHPDHCQHWHLRSPVSPHSSLSLAPYPQHTLHSALLSCTARVHTIHAANIFLEGSKYFLDVQNYI